MFFAKSGIPVCVCLMYNATCLSRESYYFIIIMSNSTTEKLLSPKRVLLKVSGECFCPAQHRGIVVDSVVHLAEQIARAAKETQIAIVMGGGNILRGSQFYTKNGPILEATAHEMGMLATVINGLALQDAILAAGHPARLMTAVPTGGVAEPYIRRRAEHHLAKGYVVLLAGGTGSPFVTTDTAAAQRSIELRADILLKATKVDGVYSDDPEKNPSAVLYDTLTYDAIRLQNLRIMDQESITKCMEHKTPILVFNYRTEGNIEKAVRGQRVGTLIR